MTTPLVIAIGIGTIWLLTVLIIKIWRTRPIPQVETTTIIQSTTQSDLERLERMAEEENQKRKAEEQNKEYERRITQAAEELRFHKMKQTRSASEAVKASLKEF